jgi:hypothetical protein
LDFLSQFRVRASYGASGASQAGRRGNTFAPGTVTIDGRSSTTGTDTPSLSAQNPGNATSSPSGPPSSDDSGRTCSATASPDYTYYRKTTHDALISVPVAPSAGAACTTPDVGRRGTPDTIAAQRQLVDNRRFGWDLTITASHNRRSSSTSSIVYGVARIIGAGGLADSATTSRRCAMYHPYTYADANHDGIIRVSGGASIRRSTTAMRSRVTSGINTGFDLFNHRLRLTSLFDSRVATARRMAPTTSATRCPLLPVDADPHRWRSGRRDRQDIRNDDGTTSFSRRRLLHERTVLEWREASAILQLPGA